MPTMFYTLYVWLAQVGVEPVEVAAALAGAGAGAGAGGSPSSRQGGLSPARGPAGTPHHHQQQQQGTGARASTRQLFPASPAAAASGLQGGEVLQQQEQEEGSDMLAQALRRSLQVGRQEGGGGLEPELCNQKLIYHVLVKSM
jgi:hypothetical protein